MTKHFCDKCGKERDITPITIVGCSEPGAGGPMTLESIEACRQCIAELRNDFRRPFPQEARER